MSVFLCLFEFTAGCVKSGRSCVYACVCVVASLRGRKEGEGGGGRRWKPTMGPLEIPVMDTMDSSQDRWIAVVVWALVGVVEWIVYRMRLYQMRQHEDKASLAGWMGANVFYSVSMWQMWEIKDEDDVDAHHDIGLGLGLAVFMIRHISVFSYTINSNTRMRAVEFGAWLSWMTLSVMFIGLGVLESNYAAAGAYVVHAAWTCFIVARIERKLPMGGISKLSRRINDALCIPANTNNTRTILPITHGGRGSPSNAGRGRFVASPPFSSQQQQQLPPHVRRGGSFSKVT